MKIVVTGIGTDVGKTVVSAILCKAFNLNYWKPIQAGELTNSDSIKVKALSGCNTLPEMYRLERPMSPHTAAMEEGITIQLDELIVPEIDPLLIEGAGGLMVPINNEGLTYLDVFKKWSIPVVVVSRHYLGSLNHTLMTVSLLKQHQIPIKGIVYVGETHPNNLLFLEKHLNIPTIGHIPLTDELDETFISQQAELIRNNTK